MKRILLALALMGSAAHAEGPDASLWAPIEAYETALNNGDLAGVMAQFTDAPVTIPNANQELFVLHREEGSNWQIARYIFATTLPAQ
ncbi:hypothetical protein [Donghicola tyrosinivorans]|uniref:DUF4440 domain-containing protein n=1 Tax=Donghicola tyrosinivorans TaxID=1652492 RepID=A0A2T0WHD6_9RHOB|nr:hypothetical protein [Donghicola tyrosinivorans]PRY86131.1 hypothetical protein CLV74_113106 [Donghicola tyrosinivorans]